MAATPIAMTVTAESTLTKQEKRILHFDLIIRDEVDVIGKGTHSRAIVDVEKFSLYSFLFSPLSRMLIIFLSVKRVQEKAAKKP